MAHRYPDLIRDIHRDGHEIGSHSFWHRLVYDQSPEEFRADLRQSLRVLEDIPGRAVTAYRAPGFSITKRSLWALEILVEEGISLDSSVFPVRHDRYGIPDAPACLHRIATPAGSLWEFPPPVVRLARLNLPLGGGGYFRLYPLSWTLRGLAHINRKARQPFLFYVHPWEVDPDQPRLRGVSALSRFRHYVNLAANERKLDGLLRRFRFGPVGDVLEEATQRRNAPCETAHGH